MQGPEKLPRDSASPCPSGHADPHAAAQPGQREREAAGTAHQAEGHPRGTGHSGHGDHQQGQDQAGQDYSAQLQERVQGQPIGARSRPQHSPHAQKVSGRRYYHGQPYEPESAGRAHEHSHAGQGSRTEVGCLDGQVQLCCPNTNRAQAQEKRLSHAQKQQIRRFEGEEDHSQQDAGQGLQEPFCSQKASTRRSLYQCVC
mmetsp:Transcript_32228/g.56583  ORF Transcript_32228/g.56583 Transcript_32228/m.56583 type:complete len:200 (+) Transcript_32228:846-1445(+)